MQTITEVETIEKAQLRFKSFPCNMGKTKGNNTVIGQIV
ncbi:hypothetical protein VIBRN418_06800 [Vibrio sp. N418]|uniref:Uncharacterized protein n=1 Tax=Vibrio scophthalmi LMG 19158 TaxID=870967 RepID=F9RJ31_9VIBR|nr:hypothetical protein VIBRN418_06800 [Vibrio sp. N418]EGU41260.1 hypothetical protein VIS19158_07857 [Vibrio scophthalmi LMG 19158]